VQRQRLTTSLEIEQGWRLTRTGPLASLETRLGLAYARPPMSRDVQRTLVYACIAWLVPCALSFLQRRGSLAMSFLHDYEAHVRGLVAIPLLLFAERPVEGRLRLIFHRMAGPPLMREDARPAFDARILSAQRFAGHPLAEAALLALAYLAAARWLHVHTSGLATWIAVPSDGTLGLTAAGAWEAAVVVPLYSFLLFRWLWRWLMLHVFFARVARRGAGLRLVATHADRAGGLGFASETTIAFAWVVFAACSMASSKWIDSILYAGMDPKSLVRPIEATVAMNLFCACFPLFAFVPRLSRLRMSALRRYGDVVARHGLRVERHWFGGKVVVTEDASSMCDLNSVFGAIRELRPVPLRTGHILVVVIAAIVPLLPVIMMIMPLREIATFALKSFM
jgi:hypothetical protein